MAEENEMSQDPKLQKRIQTLFNKGFAAFERKSYDMAIDLLYQCIEISPSFTRARKFLRMAALKRYDVSKPTAITAGIAEFKGLAPSIKAAALLKRGKVQEALLAAEKAAITAPMCARYICLVADCAFAAGEKESAIMYLETAWQLDMQNPTLMRHLANGYRACEEWKKAQEVLNALVSRFPSDGELMGLLKDTEARQTMATTWSQAGEKEGFRAVLKDAAEADKDAAANKAVITGNDAEQFIEETKAKIAAEPQNLNYYRALARLYVQAKRFDEAAEVIANAQKINSKDPELDRQLSSIRVQSFDARIAALKEKGASADDIENLTTERNQFVFDDLLQRVERYPNDLRLRYELGQQYFKYGEFDDAIQQFQLAQRSPRERNESLFGLARCFRAKKQGDMAIMQLETALEQLLVMDDMKKKVMFELGELMEERGNNERAFEIYREIYGADIGYRDIADKMERMYKLKNA